MILGPSFCRNFPENSKTIAKHQDRTFNTAHLKRTLANGEEIDRNWVLYSPSTNAIFCFMCRLFGPSNSGDIFATTGYSDFHNIHQGFSQHEKSKNHILNKLAYSTRLKESKTLTLNVYAMNQSEQEREYWKLLLIRIVAVIKHLGSRGLSFRGRDQACGSHQNGNYLGLLDLLSQFDALLASHIARYGNKGKGILCLNSYVSELFITSSELTFTSGRALYLSDTICDEFINLIGSKVLNLILAEII